MRQRIVLAAAHVLREQGFAETTTKEIARVASVSEGSIYNHFPNKTALIAATMAELTGGIREAMARLLGQAGENTVAENLSELVEAQIRFLTELLPIIGPTLGNHQLRDWLREGGPSPGAAVPAGPVLGHAGLIAYLEAEQRAGRLDAEAKPPYLAAALVGAALEYTFLTLLTRTDVIGAVAQLPGDTAEYARGVVQTVLAGHT
jgi:AcrR family transcriptional regulator